LTAQGLLEHGDWQAECASMKRREGIAIGSESANLRINAKV
jgi:hypothetical protein